jgi:hypothetical protein
LIFATAGWSERYRHLAASLPEHSLRQDFNLFVGAMAPRVLEAGSDPVVLRHALEDAWLHERVQRRWQHFVLSLGETACEAWVERLGKNKPAGAQARRTCQIWVWAAEQATEGWALAQGGQAARVDAAQPRVVAPASSPQGQSGQSGAAAQRLATAGKPAKNKSATTVASV